MAIVEIVVATGNGSSVCISNPIEQSKKLKWKLLMMQCRLQHPNLTTVSKFETNLYPAIFPTDAVYVSDSVYLVNSLHQEKD